MTFDEAYARHKRGDVTKHHVCSVCYQAGWEDAQARGCYLCGKIRPLRPYKSIEAMVCEECYARDWG